jgi:hypothetical protein
MLDVIGYEFLQVLAHNCRECSASHYSVKPIVWDRPAAYKEKCGEKLLKRFCCLPMNEANYGSPRQDSLGKLSSCSFLGRAYDFEIVGATGWPEPGAYCAATIAGDGYDCEC